MVILGYQTPKQLRHHCNQPTSSPCFLGDCKRNYNIYPLNIVASLLYSVPCRALRPEKTGIERTDEKLTGICDLMFWLTNRDVYLKCHDSECKTPIANNGNRNVIINDGRLIQNFVSWEVLTSMRAAWRFITVKSGAPCAMTSTCWHV